MINYGGICIVKVISLSLSLSLSFFREDSFGFNNATEFSIIRQ